MDERKDEQVQNSLAEELNDKVQIKEVESNDDYEDVEEDMEGMPWPGRDQLFTKPSTDLPLWLHGDIISLLSDHLVTTTSKAQGKTADECLPLLTDTKCLGLPLNSHGLPRLNREKHASFLVKWLGPLPPPYVAIDASRPWMFYWTMAGLSFLGKDVIQYRERLMETLRPLQNSTGGFGGGHGQLSHCAGTYAAVLALAAVDGLQMVDRDAMWRWLGTMKQADGGFTMAQGAEEDVRGAYCAMTILTLLNLPLDLPHDARARHSGLRTFTDGLGEWVGRCQTYEGGVAGGPTNEAHGAYAFCALACLSILDAPHTSIPRYLDVAALVRWLTGIQAAPQGGFAGRANKLVDACYSHWVGGCWALIQAALAGSAFVGRARDLWNREGAIRYLLCCAQQPGKKGGMRDKPSTFPDAYHTCYSLAGLAAAQNHYFYDVRSPARDETSGRLTAAFNWTAETASAAEMRAWKFDRADAVLPVHPVFVLPMEVVERTELQFQHADRITS